MHLLGPLLRRLQPRVLGLRVPCLDELVEHHAGVALDPQLGRHVEPDGTWVDVDLDEPRSAGEEGRSSESQAGVELRTHEEHHVRLHEREAGFRERAEAAFVAVGQQPAGCVQRRHRDPGALRERSERLPRTGPERAASDHRDGVLGLSDHLHGFPDGLGRGAGRLGKRDLADLAAGLCAGAGKRR